MRTFSHQIKKWTIYDKWTWNTFFVKSDEDTAVHELFSPFNDHFLYSSNSFELLISFISYTRLFEYVCGTCGAYVYRVMVLMYWFINTTNKLLKAFGNKDCDISSKVTSNRAHLLSPHNGGVHFVNKYD